MTQTTSDSQLSFLPAFWLLFGLGFAGILALPLILLPLVQRLIPAERTEFSPAALVVLSLIQPTVLLAIAAALGLKLAPLMDLRSHLANAAQTGRQALRPLAAELPLAAALGAGFAAAALLADRWLLPQIGSGGEALAITANRTWGTTLGAVLYGGITEELLLRWGLMTLLAWCGWRLSRQPSPGPVAIGGALGITALLFGLGHLPLALSLVPFSGWLLARTLLLNGLGGLLFGWLYWRRSLEAAMVAHITTNLAFGAIAALQ
jgi:membrane protease YdiL (CAAX protease family)